MHLFDADRRSRWFVASLVTSLIAIPVGALVAVAPPAGVAIGAGFGLLSLLTLRERFRAVFLGALTGLLIGYAFAGRTFAYLGAAPVYVGEIVLALAVLSWVAAGRWPRLGKFQWLILAFMTWGLIRTVPYVQRDGLNALRDGVIWGYALFALAVGDAVRADDFRKFVTIFRRFVPPFLLWVPVAAAVTLVMSDSIPNLPWSDVPVLTFKGGDAGVHLAGIGAFVIVGLWTERAQLSRLVAGLPLVLWFVAAAAAGAVNRGGLVAATSAWSAAFFFRPSKGWISALSLVALLIVALTATDPGIGQGQRREISIGQLQANIASLFSDEETPGGLQGTKEFRLRWWEEIVNYTVFGPYIWTGKGFGINLADDDGFQVTTDGSLRSPHNSHFSILARMGVPGLAMWIALQLAFGVSLVKAYRRSKRNGFTFWSRVDIWLLVYWVGALVNMAFDVYLEGPQGGIWFWSLVGLGLAALRIQKALPAKSDATAVLAIRAY